MKATGTRNKTINQVLFITGVILGWELLAQTGWFPPLLFPKMSAVFIELVGEIVRGEILQRLAFSLQIIGLGLGLAVVTAALTTTLALLSPLVSDWVQALMAILHPLPGIAILPIIILWLGTGARSIVAVIWFSSVWPIIANLHTGLRSVPTTQIEVGRNLGLKGIALVRSILIPGAFPYILTGLRVGCQD